MIEIRWDTLKMTLLFQKCQIYSDTTVSGDNMIFFDFTDDLSPPLQ